MIYLIEPYNAYQKPPRKKHWHEIAEEEALYARMIAETQLREAQMRTSKTQQLTVQDSVQNGKTSADTIANPACGAGAGGSPPLSFFQGLRAESVEVASFTATPTSGIGPLSVTFTDTTNTPGDDTVLWLFGSASLTSTLAAPSPVIYQTGTYTVNFQSTSSLGTATTASSQTITVSNPSFTASFTQNSPGGAHPTTVQFTDTTTYITSALDTVTWSWTFKTGSNTVSSSTLENPSVSFNTAGAYSASFVVTETTYGITSTKASSSCVVVT